MTFKSTKLFGILDRQSELHKAPSQDLCYRPDYPSFPLSNRHQLVLIQMKFQQADRNPPKF